MKLTKALLLIIAASFIFACNSGNQSKDGGKEADKEEETKGKDKTPICKIESGTIKYKLTSTQAGSGQGMNLTVHFKDYGRESVNITDVQVAGMKISSMVLIKDGYIYIYNSEDKKGSKSKLKEDAMGSSQMFIITDEAISSEGVKKIGNETVAGKECDVYEMTDKENGSSKAAIWESIVLRMNIKDKSGYEMNYEAVEVNETSDFPEGVFELPSDVQFTDADAMQKSFEEDVEKAAKDNGGDFDEEGAKG